MLMSVRRESPGVFRRWVGGIAQNGAPRVRFESVTVRIKAPAKVNLTLDVIARRSDGFHEIRSLVQGIDLCDELSVRSRAGGGVSLRCTGADLPTDTGNLVVRAIERLAEVAGWNAGVDVELHKRIPVAAGLGGGSSDAASALLAVDELWNLAWSREALARLGAEIGSDVPLFFSMPSALVTGRGERVEPTRLAWGGWIVLVSAKLEVLTDRVYAMWRPSDRDPGVEAVPSGLLTAATADELAGYLHNGLQAAVQRVYSDMGCLLEEVKRQSERGAWISGAGSTVYVPCDSAEEAARLADRLEGMGSTATVRTVRTLDETMHNH